MPTSNASSAWSANRRRRRDNPIKQGGGIADWNRSQGAHDPRFDDNPALCQLLGRSGNSQSDDHYFAHSRRPYLRGYRPVTVPQIHSGERQCTLVLLRSQIPPDPLLARS
jgi:hypothetical protein